jgi:hypothetical protein
MYSSPNITWVIKSRMAYVTCMGETRWECVSVGKCQDKKLLQINITEIIWEGMDWDEMA